MKNFTITKSALFGIAIIALTITYPIYSFGSDIGDDITKIYELTLKAEQGDAVAQFNLGVKYDNGQGVPQDYAEAVKWYRKAAEQGDAGAIVVLKALGEY